MKDEFAPWRNKDPWTLNEAASMLANVPPSRPDPRNAAEQAKDERPYWRRAIEAGITDNPAVKLVCTIVKKDVGRKPQHNSFTDQTVPGTVDIVVDWDRSTVRQSDLKDWCKSVGFTAEVFNGSTGEKVSDSDLPDYLRDRINLIRRMWKEHFRGVSEGDKTTLPSPTKVNDWLSKNGVKKTADQGAYDRILKPEWALKPGKAKEDI